MRGEVKRAAKIFIIQTDPGAASEGKRGGLCGVGVSAIVMGALEDYRSLFSVHVLGLCLSSPQAGCKRMLRGST